MFNRNRATQRKNTSTVAGCFTYSISQYRRKQLHMSAYAGPFRPHNQTINENDSHLVAHTDMKGATLWGPRGLSERLENDKQSSTDGTERTHPLLPLRCCMKHTSDEHG